MIPKLGQLSTALEENTTKAYQQQSLEEVREEHKNYFEAISQHPYLLVDKEVPAIGRDGMVRLTSSQEAREWQEAVKSVLAEEVRDRASRAMEESADFLETVHASIELFQNNTDLIPGTKGFDVDLANQFAEMAKPYEVRIEDKLQGYSIPVQPIIDQLRTRLSAQRSAEAPANPAPKGAAAAASTPAAADPPQAGIPSKAGSSAEKDDFSTLFGTIGLPNLQV